MNQFYLFLLSYFFVLPISGISQITEAYEDFEGTSNIPLWNEDYSNINTNFTNPHPEGSNLSSTVLKFPCIY